MKEIELPVKSNDRISIEEITTSENGIILVYKDSDVVGFITFENYGDPIWNYCDTINTSSTPYFFEASITSSASSGVRSAINTEFTPISLNFL